VALLTREEHLSWSKKRALEYLDHGEDPREAVTSMLSDLAKHPELENHVGIKIGIGLMVIGNLRTPAEARRFIEGFN
jgi:hypothetical protein